MAVALAVVALPWLWLWHLRVTTIEPSTSCEHERRVGIARVGGRVRQCHASAEHQGQRAPHVRHAVETGCTPPTLRTISLGDRQPVPAGPTPRWSIDVSWRDRQILRSTKLAAAACLCE